ncbi:MAG: GYF domain-containing protein [Pseudomonadota bacterium]|nr:GYF domain-containing protein [Pseudomonadota bacterium]
MEKIWFYYSEDNVTGPFTTDEIKSKAALSEDATSFVWVRGQKKWIPINQLNRHLDEIISRRQSLKQEPQNWFLNYGGRSLGPMVQAELIRYLRTVSTAEFDNVLIWSMGMENWAKVFEFPPIADELGVSRRTHPRVPLNAVVILNVDGVEQTAQALTISVGGIGVAGFTQLEKGKVVKLSIKSPDLSVNITASAVVKYLIKNEEAGLQFKNLHLEMQARIIDYVKKFKNLEEKPNRTAA